LARNDSPDIPFDRSINPYRGCEHGCIYCFARPSHAYLGLSPGLDFETRIFVKEEAPELLRAELAGPSYACRTIALGANTDPYQPAERQYGVTRRVLEVLRELRHPVSIVTKSALVSNASRCWRSKRPDSFVPAPRPLRISGDTLLFIKLTIHKRSEQN